MGLASIMLGLGSFILMVLGFFFGMVPFAGAVLAFGGPLVGIAGIVCGGIALSRARQDGTDNGLAVAGLAVSGVAFIMSLLVALTCGLCNAMMSTSLVQDQPFDVFNSPSSQPNPQPNFPPNFPQVQPNPQPNVPPNFPQAQPNPQPDPTNPSTPVTPQFSGAQEPCERARICCMAFTDNDAAFCEASLGAAQQQGDPGSACAELYRRYGQGIAELGDQPPDACSD